MSENFKLKRTTVERADKKHPVPAVEVTVGAETATVTLAEFAAACADVSGRGASTYEELLHALSRPR